MIDPSEFDDPGPLPLDEPSRLRRVASATIVILLIVSMVFLAWVSGRGELRVPPDVRPTVSPISAEAPGWASPGERSAG
jgi:hypothetical protein